jgi:retinol-binding protein 3
MLRRARSLCLAAALVAAPLGAQSAGPPAIPDTPAGRVLRAWLDAFNTGDTARMAAYYRRHQPDADVPSRITFRERTGGFDLLTIERSEPRHIEFTIRERKAPTNVYGVLEVSDADPPVSTANLLQAMSDGGPAGMRLDAAGRARVIDRAIAKLDSFYVFPAVARRMADSLRARRARGAYDAETNGLAFAMRLDRELRDIAGDKHLGVRYSARAIPPRPAGPPPAPTPEQRRQMQAQMDQENCGFRKAEVLEGNVGYVKFDFFADPETCGATADAALSFLAGTRALVVDLRENGGGSPAMVAHVQSHLFDRRTHVNDLWTRSTDSTAEFWTRDSVPGRRFGGEKPVYVLTSSRTFSGAEEFSYNLKSLRRATIVGETTGGGAHPVNGQRLDEHFVIGVPFARAVNPITKTNWEGTGVAPDVAVPAADALATAQRLIRERPKP